MIATQQWIFITERNYSNHCRIGTRRDLCVCKDSMQSWNGNLVCIIQIKIQIYYRYIWLKVQKIKLHHPLWQPPRVASLILKHSLIHLAMHNGKVHGQIWTHLILKLEVRWVLNNWGKTEAKWPFLRNLNSLRFDWVISKNVISQIVKYLLKC